MSLRALMKHLFGKSSPANNASESAAVAAPPESSMPAMDEPEKPAELNAEVIADNPPEAKSETAPPPGPQPAPEGAKKEPPAAEIAAESPALAQPAVVDPAQEIPAAESPSPAPPPAGPVKKIWLVESDKENMTREFLQVIGQLGLEAVAVHSRDFYRQPFADKIQKHPEITFAVVLLGGDDFAYPKDSKPALARLRACQQTVFELGYLLAKLGRQNIFVSYYEHKHFSLPTDLLDAIYVPYNLSGEWRQMLVTRLRVCGFPIDESLAQRVTVEKNR